MLVHSPGMSKGPWEVAQGPSLFPISTHRMGAVLCVERDGPSHLVTLYQVHEQPAQASGMDEADLGAPASRTPRSIDHCVTLPRQSCQRAIYVGALRAM